MTVRLSTAAVMLSVLAFTRAGAQRTPRAAEQPKAQYKVQTNEDLQPAALPPLPAGMTTDMLVEGDRLFHGRGGCFACHGAEAQGLPAAGDGITTALSYARHEWTSIDSLINASTFHEAKAYQILEISRRVVEELGGELPCDRDVLLSFAGGVGVTFSFFARSCPCCRSW